MLKYTLKSFVPVHVLESLKRNVLYFGSDLWDSISGSRDPLVPPKRMIFIGGMDFKKVGDEFFEYFKAMGNLTPNSSVLDVGSGIGRMARPLTSYLSKNARYDGFDIDQRGVSWCRENILTRFSNFNFQRADIYNKYYNPSGKYKSSEYQFPYRDASFDFTYLTSVFTHMFPADVDNYISQISRTLNVGGKSLITFFLANPESTQLIREKKSALNFQYEVDGYLTVDLNVPENAICFQEIYIKSLFQKHGLAINGIHYGSWCGREEFLSFQDIIVATKL